MKKPVVGFVGMTHLGLVSGSAIASRGFKTLCFDRSQLLVDRLRRGLFPVLEPGLEDLVSSNGSLQHFTAAMADLAICDVVYVAPDVPTDDSGRSDTAEVSALIADAAAVLDPSAVLVLLSQVEPGFTRSLSGPPLVRRYYQVETLVFGRAVERAIKPERYIIGCADPARPLDSRLHQVLSAFDCPILPMGYESAELAKIAINSCLAASVSVANTLAEVCERIGADWSEIAPSLRLDKRIGRYSYLTPGLGIAGGNIERDLATVCRMADARGSDAGFVHACLRNSSYRRDWPLRILHNEVLGKAADPVIAVLGLTYKENTHSTKNSPSVALIRRLRGARLRIFDPSVAADLTWHDNFTTASGIDTVCEDAHALVIMTPWPDFRALDPQMVASQLRGRVVVDPFNVLDRDAVAIAGLRHFVLGAPAPPSE